MKTVITEQIQGYTIVLGIGDPVVDAVKTRFKVDEKIKNDPLIGEIQEKTKQALLLAKKWNQLRRKRRKSAQVQTLDEQYKAVCLEIHGLKKQVDEKRFEMFQAKPEYFHPKPGEELISDSESDKYLEMLPVQKNEKLTVDGILIPDYRGVDYWIKTDGRWNHETVIKIGVELPDGHVLENDLTDGQKLEIGEQFEQARISKLSDEEKDNEIEKILKSLLTQAALKKTELEIQGDPNALEESKKWYMEESRKIEKRYQ